VPRLPRRAFIAGTLIALAGPLAADAQPARVFHVGVIIQGGPSYYPAVDGLREGLRELGLEDGKQLVLHVHDAKGDLRAVEAAARNPGELPIEQIDRIPFVVNAKTAKALQLTIPPAVLARADETIR
jgi:ABC-type uncharacterized transport system substrate-binding protein